MKASTLRRGMLVWPPFLFAGIRVTRISGDFREIDVELRHGRLNMNYIGTHYGGSLFSMTDPFYVVMLMNVLGRDYVVWDKTATIEFVKPGTGTVKAAFRVTDDMLADIAAATPNEGDKFEPVYKVEIVDESGEVVARVTKTMYIRRQPDRRRRIGD